MAGTKNPGTKEPGTREPGAKEPETKRPGTKELGFKAAGGKEHESLSGDDDSESETETDNVVKESRETDFSDANAAKQFEAKFKDHFGKAKKKSVLHALAESKNYEKGQESFVKWLRDNYSELLMCQDSSDYSNTPLHIAINKKNRSFARLALDAPNIKEVLKLTNSYGKTCLHLAIEKRFAFTELLMEKCDDKNEAFRKKDNTGRTPLHLAVNVLRSIPQNMYVQDQSSAIQADNGRTYNPHSRAVPEAQSKKSMKPEEDKTKSITFNAERIIDLLIEVSSETLGEKDESGDTPYQLLLLRLRKTKRSVEADSNGVESKIKYHCMQAFSREEAIKALYKPGQERQIEFDLSGFPKNSISHAYLEKIAKHVQFESILQYVALPRLFIERSIPSSKVDKINSPPDWKGLTDLKVIFDWLYDKRVRRILKVMVVDDGDISHSDEVIEEALRRFQVEVWDWKKLDISSETIFQAAENVKEISLYSTGNNAVLMGWYSDEGLKKFPKLTKVHLFIREGLETRERLGTYIKTFRDKLTSNSRIAVDVVRDNKHKSFASEFSNDIELLPRENHWIDIMTDFAVFINNIRDSDKEDYIKVAVIDDGIDGSLENLDGKIAGGISFCPSAVSSKLIKTYYVPSGTHGTAMASLICKICPKTKLYVARLAEYRGAGGKRQITAESAAKAILWAVECEVDIISMSWSIETTFLESPGLKELKSAIDAAEKAKITMFCSASDQGEMSSKFCYPGSWSKCIRIGACTATGERCTWVHGEAIDFLLPGKDILVDGGGGDGAPPSYQSGSSFATALATGLGALLLYCNERVSPRSKEGLRELENMKNAFSRLSSDGKFPRVKNYFDLGSENGSWGDMEWNDETSKKLARIMGDIRTRNFC